MGQVTLTPDILEELKQRNSPSEPPPVKRQSESSQFIILLAMVAALLLSIIPVLTRQTNYMISGSTKTLELSPVGPTPTPDASLLPH